MANNGRGAWNARGVGGTKKYKDETKPGPYYYLGTGYSDTNADEHAVRRAVVAYQAALNNALKLNLTLDGKLGPVTSRAITRYQVKHESQVGTPWGGIGPETSYVLLYPHAKAAAKASSNKLITTKLVTGTVRHESLFDAGAVGYSDPTDYGLAQINGTAHPDLSIDDRLTPSVAFKFVVDYYTNALSKLDNNLRDAVASYNLGIGGTRSWIKAGRPNDWQPSANSSVRHPNAYIDSILKG